jgi:adenylate cyclase
MSDAHRKCILVVDDAPENIAVATGALKDTYRTKVATNGFRALLLAEAEDRPDLILLDVMMPAMDGPAMLQKLRSTRATSHIPIVLLTSRVQAVENGSYAHLPVAGILLKPFDPLRLAGQIAAALGWES